MKKPFQFSPLKYPDKCVFHAIDYEHKSPLHTVHPDIEYTIYSGLRMQMADFITKARMEKIDKEYVVEYRMQLYVFTPEEFHEMVENEVQRQIQLYGYGRVKVIE